MVTLTNTSGKIKVYNLDHPFFRSKKWGARRMNIVVIEEHKDGRRMPKTLKRSFPGSLTLRAGESRAGLPPQIQAVPAIRKDIRENRLSVKPDEVEKTEKKPQEKPVAEKSVVKKPATKKKD